MQIEYIITRVISGLHSYLQGFSESFRLAVGLWPVIALVLTAPILIYEYVRFRRIGFMRIVMWYGFVLYLLGLLALTLYPLPDNPAVFCSQFQVETITQKVPLENIAGALESRSVFLQVAMNVAFFVPFGIFLRYLFGVRVFTAALLLLAGSLFLEIAQWTGAFGYYPCRYRMFDIDDLIANTLGGMIGFALAWIVGMGDHARE